MPLSVCEMLDTNSINTANFSTSHKVKSVTKRNHTCKINGNDTIYPFTNKVIDGNLSGFDLGINIRLICLFFRISTLFFFFLM